MCYNILTIKYKKGGKTVIIKIIALFCMLVLIFFLLMIMGFIPSQKIIKFLHDKLIVQVCIGVVIMTGLLSAVITVTT